MKYICIFALICFQINTNAQKGLKDYFPSGKYIGTAVTQNFYGISDAKIYQQTLVNEYNILVPENVMKFSYIQPKQGIYDFSKSDSLANFARKHGIKLRGHTLVWHNQLPTWLTSKSWSRTELLLIMKNHIDTLVKRYNDIVIEWDVVNEAFTDGSPVSLRSSVWRTNIGSDYIDSAFVYARRASSNVCLFYNDYDIEQSGAKADTIFNKVKRMKEKNIPIDGVGFQFHKSFNLSEFQISNFETNIMRFANAGFKIAFTELDLSMSMPINTIAYPTQAYDYGRILRLFLKIPQSTSFLTWGFTDKYSWIPSFSNYTRGVALPFDANYNKKPAYDTLRNVLSVRNSVSDTKTKNNMFEIYPNPVSNFLFINTECNHFGIEIMDIYGRILYNPSSFDAKRTINISFLKSGVYFIKFKYDGKKIVYRFLKT